MVWPLGPLAAQRPAQNWRTRLLRSGTVLERVPAGLREHGYGEGQNIQFEFRSADGNQDFLRALADELVRLKKVDIIVASQTPSVIAARQATSEILIVMAPAGDPSQQVSFPA